jgi:FkbM family methyltransferase
MSFRDYLKTSLPDPLLAALRGARSRLRAITWRMRRLEYALPSGLRVGITSPSDWYVYNEIFVERQYDAVIDPFIARAPTDTWVLDVGANVGYFTARLVDRWVTARGDASLHVVCVEGAPQTFRQLVGHLAQPRLAAMCTAHLGLAGRRSGTAHISCSANSGVNSIVDRSPSFFRAEVPFLDLATLVPADARIGLLKVDIEGAEEILLENYRDLMSRVDVVVIELHHLFCDTERCRRLLAEAGLTHGTVLHIFEDGCSLEGFTRPAGAPVHSELVDIIGPARSRR